MDFTFFNQLMIILALSICIIPICHRLNLPESLGYLITGIILGPIADVIHKDFDIRLLAEIGVVFLLFTLGLEFSLKKIRSMKSEVFGLGGMQVILSLLLISGVLFVLKIPIKEALIIAAGVSLSSTAIVSKELTKSNGIRSRQGQLTIGILLFQDISAVLFLILVPTLAGAGSQEVFPAIGLALVKGTAFIAIMLFIGKWLLPVIFKEIATSRSEELFVLAALMVALTAAWFTHMLGLSMALGGFVAGMMLGESNYKHQVEMDIRPFRDILLGLFFVSVGLMLDMDTLKSHWLMIPILTLALLVTKFIIITILAKFFEKNNEVAFKTGLTLCQGGEFCFALIALSTQYGQTGGDNASIVLSVIILSMLIAPLLIRGSERMTQFVFHTSDETEESSCQEIKKQAAHINNHTLVCGYGRVGQTICRFLAKEKLPYIAIDDDALHIHEARIAGEPVFYGDCRRIELLNAVGLSRSRQVVICVDKTSDALKVVKIIRQKDSLIPILVRTKDLSQGQELQQAGATIIVPEVLESSLLIVKKVFFMLGMERSLIQKKVQQTREQQYSILSGYYPGVADLYNDNLETSSCHAVSVDKSSACIGMTVADLPLEAGVSVMSIKRQGVDYEPQYIDIVQHKDVLILTGAMADLEQSEKNID